MSGGVDSTVAAALLQQQGNTCAGVTLRLFEGENDKIERSCCSLADVEDARMAAQRLGIPHYVFNFAELFEQTVIRRFANAYAAGQTPNPCIDCNRFIKFAALLDRAETLHYNAIATGHYAQARYDSNSGRWLLFKGADNTKDQSYVLYALTQQQLAKTRFPLGSLKKSQVREIAAENNFWNAQKKDSQDICFVPDGDYAGFLERQQNFKAVPGDFIDPAGRLLGRHKGYYHYTIGQRKGLGLALPKPGYVCNLNPQQNSVTVGGKELLFNKEFFVRELNWIAFDALTAPLHCKCKVRYRQTEQACELEQLEPDLLRVQFAEPQRAITPGQAAVFYDGDCVLGGGTIASF